MKSPTNIGMIFPAYGAEYIQMAAVAAKSAREAGNTCPIHLHTNIREAASSAVLQGLFDKIIITDEPSNKCLFVKIEADKRSPFTKTIVMDADQLVLQKIDDALDILLDKFDLCVPLRVTPARTRYDLPGLASQEQFSHWNTGMFGFSKTEASRELFETWRGIHIEENWKADQPSFAKAVFLCPEARVLGLDISWGWMRKYHSLARLIKDQIKIEHYVDVNHSPKAARDVLIINAQLHKESSVGRDTPLCLSHRSKRRYRFIASRLYDNPMTPIMRRSYNAIKPFLGIKRRIKLLHKTSAWKD